MNRLATGWSASGLSRSAALIALVAWLPSSSVYAQRSKSGVTLDEVEIVALVPGHEGPMYATDPAPPIVGGEAVAKASIFGKVKDIEFDLIDISGKVIQPRLPIISETNHYSVNEALMTFTVPNTPFRIQMRGATLANEALTLVSRNTFSPVEGVLKSPKDRIIEEFEKASGHKAPAEVREYVGSMVAAVDASRHPRLQAFRLRDIQNVADEPYVTAKGNVIGLRMTFTVTFPEKTYVEVYPVVRPGPDFHSWLYTNHKPAIDASRLSGTNSYDRLAMRILQRTITPAPEQLQQERYQIPESGETFEAGQYEFEFIMVPNLLNTSATKGQLCFIAPTNPANTKGGDDWITVSDQPFNFQVSVNNLPYGGYRTTDKVTKTAITPSALYASIIKEGFPDCSEAEARAIFREW